MRKDSGAALTEILVAVLFFALSAAGLARLFAAADGIASQSALREDAAMAAREWAERAAAGGGVEEMLLEGGWARAPEGFTRGQSGYKLHASVSRETTGAGTLWRVTFTALDDSGDALIVLTAHRYDPAPGGAP